VRWWVRTYGGRCVPYVWWRVLVLCQEIEQDKSVLCCITAVDPMPQATGQGSVLQHTHTHLRIGSSQQHQRSARPPIIQQQQRILLLQLRLFLLLLQPPHV